MSGRSPSAALNFNELANGAPRPMKMGTTASPWRYDAAAAQAIRPAPTTDFDLAPRRMVRLCSRLRGWPGYPSNAAISINPGNGVMG
jgi:hypothetical protein